MKLPDFQDIMPDQEEEWRRKMVSVPVDETIELRRAMRDSWQLPVTYDGQVTGVAVINKWIDVCQGCLDYFGGVQTGSEFPRKCVAYLDEVYRDYPGSVKDEITEGKIQASLRALKNLVGGDQEKQEMLKTDPGVIKEIWRLCLLHAMLNPSSKAAEIFPETSLTGH